MPTYIKSGFWLETKTKFDHWLNLDEFIQNHSGGIPDAPSTGDIYGRQNGNWVIISDSSQNLQQTLQNGNTSDIAIQLFDNLEFPNANHTITYDASILQDITSNFLIGFDSNTHSFVSTKYDTNERILLKYDKIEFLTLGSSNTIKPSTFNSNTTFTLPGKATGNYTLATLDDIVAPGLDQVLSVSNIATNRTIRLNHASGAYVELGSFFNTVSNPAGSLSQTGFDSISFVHPTLGSKAIVANFTGSNANVLFQLPNKSSGTYNLATESAISGTFANPTSITVVNGIITAIS